MKAKHATIDELCKLLKWDRREWFRMVERGTLTENFLPRRIPRSWPYRYDVAAVKRWAKSLEVKPRKGRA